MQGNARNEEPKRQGERMSKQTNKQMLEEVYARLRACLAAVEPSNERLSGAMRSRLDYNIHFLRAFIELQGDNNTDVQAIGFYDESENEEEEDYEDGTDEEYGGKA